MKKLNIFENIDLSITKDPFKKELIQAIHIHAYPKYGTDEWTSSIEFKNGNTEGTQKFKVIGFENLISDMKSFTENLK